MNNEIRVGLAWAGSLLVLALGASLARSQGVIDKDTMLRLVIGANGLMIAYFGNRTPKAMAPSNRARQVARVSGWSSVVSGTVYAALWAFAPVATALTVGSGVIAAGLFVTIGYCFWLRGQKRTREQGGSA